MDNQEELNKLVSVHLGKAGDGTVVKPYVTPDNVDPTLLVAVPRQLNRTAYGLDGEKLPFVGRDSWNSYEFSTLLKNGYPISGWLKFVYNSHSPNIVESKSVKLYLNSYNMARLIDTHDEIYKIEKMIEDDLQKAIGGPTSVEACLFINPSDTVRPFNGDFISLEFYCDVENMSFDRYNESADILEVIPTKEQYAIKRRSHSLRSNCRVTNQPDWGDVYIHVKGKKGVTDESLLQYIISMRKENHFHEEICECIYKRLWDLLEPEELLVGCLYTRRGGIDINPVRSSSMNLLYDHSIINPAVPSTKTPRQ